MSVGFHHLLIVAADVMVAVDAVAKHPTGLSDTMEFDVVVPMGLYCIYVAHTNTDCKHH